jgi:hypothetical protein
LRAPTVLGRVVECVDRLLENAEPGNGSSSVRPLVATVFSNEDWSLPDMFLADFLYGKPDYAFAWTTHGGRTERLKAFRQNSSKYGVFSNPRYGRVSAIVLADKEWERDKVVFSLRVLHNPWAEHPVPPETFSDFAQYKPVDKDGETSYLAWSNQHRARFRLP